MNDETVFVVNRFPTYRNKILSVIRANDEFKSLCEDYYTASKTLEGFQQKMVNDVKHELEYRKVLVDLEDDILKFLDREK